MVAQPKSRNHMVHRLTAMGGILLACSALTLNAQDSVRLSGVIFADYSYTVTSPAGASDGENAFGYRRAFLTADFVKSERFSGRMRLDGAGRRLNGTGPQTTFVKDLYLVWSNALGDGHDLTFGISRPPVFIVSEAQWGYRGLEKTIQDRAGVASSRDQGVKLTGPLGGGNSFRYALMVAGNTNVSPEDDKYKRVYGQLEFRPENRFHGTLGGTFADRADGSQLHLNGFMGYTFGDTHAGVEAFHSVRTTDAATGDLERTGVSVFARHSLSETKGVVGRIDVFETPEVRNTWITAGFVFAPESGIQFVPNLIWSRNDVDDNPEVTARVTMIVAF